VRLREDHFTPSFLKRKLDRLGEQPAISLHAAQSAV
jgi:hypothetical protein